MNLARITQLTYYTALLSYFSLLGLLTAWTLFFLPETFNAPFALWLIQIVPLCIPLYGLLRRHGKAFLFASLLVLLYFAHAITVVMQTPSDELIYTFAQLEIILIILFFSLTMFYLKLRKKIA